MMALAHKASDWAVKAWNETRRERKALYPAAAAVLAAGIFVIAMYQLALVFRDHALSEARESARNRLELIAVGLKGELAKFETAAEILAGDEKFRAFLRGHDSVAVDEINARLEEVSNESGALDVYLMDSTGKTLAASNWNEPVSFVGRNFGYRPYFQEAVDGGLGRFFAVGTTSRRRGYYFAYPVAPGSQVIGVVAVKMRIDHLESIWQRNGSDVVVADDNGIVFMATDPGLRLRSLRPIPADVRERIRQTRQYPEDAGDPIALDVVESFSPHERIVRISTGEGGTGARRLMQEQPMPEAGWTLITFSSLKPVDQAVFRSTVLVAACILALFGLLWVAFERHRRARERFLTERRHRGELEKLVDERTRHLQTAYDELRSVQEQLVLNSRFAVMGRLSAGLTHEISQPLTAIAAHLDNTSQLIAKDRVEEARKPLSEIYRLTARITAIVRQLKNLARGSHIELKAVSVRQAIDTAMRHTADKLREEGVEVNIAVPESVHVMAEPVLLEQVFVNLFNNAAQALSGRPAPRVSVDVSQARDRIEILVSDNGPGLDPARLEEIFEPFMTTRSGDGGLGLGLTIVQDTVNRFGGRVRAENKPGGQGLVITLALKPAHGGTVPKAAR